MAIKFRSVEYKDKDIDNCGNTSVAVLEIGSISIPLCNECVVNLMRDVHRFKRTIFCKDCRYWHCNKHGVRYGGTCELKVGESFSKLSEGDFGGVCRTEFMNTCEHAAIRK